MCKWSLRRQLQLKRTDRVTVLQQKTVQETRFKAFERCCFEVKTRLKRPDPAIGRVWFWHPESWSNANCEMVLTSPSRWVPCQMRQTLAASVFWPMHQCKHFDGTLLAFWFLGSEKYRSISGGFFSESSLRMPKCFCTSRHIWNHDPWLPQLRGYVETKSQKAMWNRRVTSLAMINVLVSNWNHVLHASAWDENCFLLFPVPSFTSRLASQCHRLYRQLVVTCHLSRTCIFHI